MDAVAKQEAAFEAVDVQRRTQHSGGRFASARFASARAGSMAGRRLVLVIELLGAFGIKLTAPIVLLVDNSAAGDLTKKFGVSARTAHFLRWQHYYLSTSAG